VFITGSTENMIPSYINDPAYGVIGILFLCLIWFVRDAVNLKDPKIIILYRFSIVARVAASREVQYESLENTEIE